VEPRALTVDAVGPFDERVHAGVLYTGLSMLARRIADDSALSSAAISSLSVLEALERDLDDGTLDGAEVGGSPIEIGACAPIEPDAAVAVPICTFTACTLRGDLAESVALFLADPTVNRSALVFGDVHQLMMRIATRSSALFADAVCQLDGRGPDIVIQGIGDDENIQDNDPVPGVLNLEITVTDAVAVSEVDPIRVARDGVDLAEGVSEAFTVVREQPDPRTQVITVDFDTRSIPDGPVELIVSARDHAQNESVLTWT
jgi:hypothetical protein